MDCKLDIYDAIEQQTGATNFNNQIAMDIESMPITIDGVDITGPLSNSNYIIENRTIDPITLNTELESITPQQQQWSLDGTHRMEEADSHLLIGNSMTICDDGSGENSADTTVAALRPSIHNLELEQKFNDAESYLIESGEINGDGTGRKLTLLSRNIVL